MEKGKKRRERESCVHYGAENRPVHVLVVDLIVVVLRVLALCSFGCAWFLRFVHSSPQDLCSSVDSSLCDGMGNHQVCILMYYTRQSFFFGGGVGVMFSFH